MNVACMSAVCLLAMTGFARADSMARDRIEIVATPLTYAISGKLTHGFATTRPFQEPRSEAMNDASARFCAGVGLAYPDIAITLGELPLAQQRACRAAGVTPIVVTLGYSGLAIVKSASAPALDLSARDLFLAIAKDVPGAEGALTANAIATWASIDPKLPKIPIEIAGPPAGSAAEAALSELVLSGRPARSAPAYRVRAAGEDVAQALAASANAFVIVDLNAALPKGASFVRVEGAPPERSSFQSGAYPLARPLMLTVKREHVGIVPGLEEFLDEALGAAAIGQHGYLTSLGVVPAPSSKHGVTAGAILSHAR